MGGVISAEGCHSSEGHYAGFSQKGPVSSDTVVTIWLGSVRWSCTDFASVLGASKWFHRCKLSLSTQRLRLLIRLWATWICRFRGLNEYCSREWVSIPPPSITQLVIKKTASPFLCRDVLICWCKTGEELFSFLGNWLSTSLVIFSDRVHHKTY
jgi:hypothetical protein